MDALPLPLVDPMILRAFEEDFGLRGDITTDCLIPQGTKAKAVLRARKSGTLAGAGIALRSFQLLDPAAKITLLAKDGNALQPGQDILHVESNAHAVLGAERTALNFACHMSGIATATAAMASLVRHTKAKICCTRKTTPGLRALEKYAVRMGGGVNHRYRLDDGILIKDNHIAVAGGIRRAVEQALANRSHMMQVEVEVDTVDQLEAILDLPVDAVLLDNMSPETLKHCVGLIGGRFKVEASGSVNAHNIVAIAETGVDLISMGWLTHSAPALDLGLDIDL